LGRHCSDPIPFCTKENMSRRGTTFERKWRFLRSSSKQIQRFSRAPFVVTVELGFEAAVRS
jgi:hypothetical protein